MMRRMNETRDAHNNDGERTILRITRRADRREEIIRRLEAAFANVLIQLERDESEAA